MTYLLHINIIFSFLFLLSGCNEPVVTKSGLSVKIGVIAPLSGDNASLGNNAFNGIKLARKLTPLLENGDEIILIVKDDQSDPVKAVSVLNYLVNQEKVTAILLLSASESAIAIASVADKYKTPILATLATNPETIKHNQYISQLAFDDATQALVAALFVRDELFIKKVAVFNNPDSVYSNFLANEFSKQFKLLGGEITDFINIEENGPNDYVKIVAQVASKEPDLLYFPVNAHSALAIAKELTSHPWSPKALVTDGMLSNVIEEHNGDLSLINGMLATDLYSSDMALSAFGKKVFNHIEDSNLNVTTHALTGIEGYGLLVNAIDQCESPYKQSCVQRHIRSTDGFTGLSGKIIIDKNGKADHTLFINAIENGEMKIRVKVN